MVLGPAPESQKPRKNEVNVYPVRGSMGPDPQIGVPEPLPVHKITKIDLAVLPI